MQKLSANLAALSVIAVLVCAACASRRGPLRAPAGGGPLELDAVWTMLDRKPHPDCADDPRGFFHVDVTSQRFSFATCGGKKIVVERALDEREVSAIEELVARIPRASSERSGAPPGDCPRVRWRDAGGEHASDPGICRRSRSDGLLALNDVVDLLTGLRADDACGGPGSRLCPEGHCGGRRGLVPYAFGSCMGASAPGEVTVGCLTLAYCPAGWREGTEEECSAARPCRWVSAGCGDELLCAKCGASEACPVADDAPK